MTRSQAVRLAWALLLSALALAPAIAQAEDPPSTAAGAALVGTRVILRAQDTPLKVGAKVVAHGDVHRVYRVERASGPWLWLVAGAVRGWAQAGDVIPFDRALEYFTAELRKTTSNAWAYQMRGLIWYDLQDYDKAIADEDEAISIAPKDSLAYFNRGNAYFAKRDYIRAIADYNEATRLDPRDADTYENRALAWAAQHEHNIAIADFNEAIRLDPEGLSKYRRRGQSWVALHQYEHALADYDHVLQVAPNDLGALNGRAWVLATCPQDSLRSGSEAAAAATRVCTLTDWKDPYALGTLAAASAEVGDYPAAVKWQTRALELFPKDDPALERHRQRLASYQAEKPWRDLPGAKHD